ncbi:MAG: hypothetical protein QW041_01275 [Candidatus Pacearchaeota archaeon]
MNRGGTEDLLWNLGLILIFLFVAGILFVWESNQVTGKAVKSEIIAKQTALLIDSGKPGTIIFVDANITIEGNKIIAYYENSKFEYSFFNKNKISYKQTGRGTEIKIE